MSALGEGLLSGFAGALQAKEDDYRETRTLEKKRTLEEWRMQKEAEYRKMLGDYEYKRERADVEADAIAERKHELEKLNIQETGKDRRAKENRDSVNASRRLEVKARSDSLRSAATGDLLNTLDGLAGGPSETNPWNKEKLPKTFPETISALKKWKDSVGGQQAVLAEEAAQLLLELERLGGKTDATETEFLEWQTQWQELMQKFSRPDSPQFGNQTPAQQGEPGDSPDNPIDATTITGPPPEGKWVKTPDGKVRQSAG